jgi:hypothetical protein
MFTSRPLVDWAAKLSAVYRGRRDRFTAKTKGSASSKRDDESRPDSKAFDQKRNRSIRDKLGQS